MTREELEQKILTKEEVIQRGIEFAGDVCYSGRYGQQVYTREMEDGGLPVEGILYEYYPNGALNYYCYYKNGISHGVSVRFYESGHLKSYCIMDMGTIDGDDIEFYENGQVKQKRYSKYGVIMKNTEYDEEGNVTAEKTQMTEGEQRRYESMARTFENGQSVREEEIKKTKKIGKLQLMNVEKYEYCALDKRTGSRLYSEENFYLVPTIGEYFKDNKTFFALYPTESELVMYYKGMEYPLKKELHISLKRWGRRREFSVKEYGICIRYKAKYAVCDRETEKSVDLFYRIEQSYQDDLFYEKMRGGNH